MDNPSKARPRPTYADNDLKNIDPEVWEKTGKPAIWVQSKKRAFHVGEAFFLLICDIDTAYGDVRMYVINEDQECVSDIVQGCGFPLVLTTPYGRFIQHGTHLDDIQLYREM
jgi:hypothetical protein